MLGKQQCKEILSPTPLSASRQVLQKQPVVLNPLLGVFIKQGRWSLERRLEVDTILRHGLSQTSTPPMDSPKGPSFCKNHFLNPKGSIHPLSLLRWY